MAFLGVILTGISLIVSTTVITPEVRNIEEQIKQNKIREENEREKLNNANIDLVILSETLVHKRENLQNTLQTCNEIIENADRYLAYEPNVISGLLHAIMCYEIGEDIPMDHELFLIRQKTFQPIA